MKSRFALVALVSSLALALGCGGSSGGDVNPTAATPSFSPIAGTYATAQSVTIASATAGATIRYTTDGSTPTVSSAAYASPVSVGSSMTLKAIATASGYTNSAVGTSAYVIGVTPTTACPTLKSSRFPSCLALASPTSLVAKPSGAPPAAGRASQAAVVPAGFQTAFAKDAQQIADLLSGVVTNPGAVLVELGTRALTNPIETSGPGVTTVACFGPRLYYANHPDAVGSPTFRATGQLPPGDLGIWKATESSGESCSAAVLNALLGAAGDQTQFALAVAAVEFQLAGSHFPVASGETYDVAAALQALVQGASAQVTVSAATIAFIAPAYVYTTRLAVAVTGGSISVGLKLTQVPGSTPEVYTGTVAYTFDDGTAVTGGTVRFERTSATVLDISARRAGYPTGYTPTLDASGELNPGDPKWIYSFSRFGATFDPSSTGLAGNYVFSSDIQTPGSQGPASVGPSNVFQVTLPGNGSGAAFYGYGSVIDQNDSWAISFMQCLRASGVRHLKAQYQPIEIDAATGRYLPSASILPQIRFAPVSTCNYASSAWNNGAAGGFWYDRPLQYVNSPTPPTPPSPIPEDVVADPVSATYPQNLFGDGTTAVQTLIGTKGFVRPRLF